MSTEDTERKNSSNEGDYTFLVQTPRQFLERRLATNFGINSDSMRALDLVKKEMCKERGYRRDDGQDYYNHCIDVANTLISFCVKDEDTICAGLLHDIVEDVDGYTKETIRELFNDNISKLVMLVTKDPNKNYKDEEVLEEYLEEISKNMYASAIKTADRMHNMMTLQEKTFEARYRKLMETKRFYMPFFKKCRQLYPRYENLFYAARTQIYPLIFEVESLHNEIETLKKENEELRKKLTNV